MQRIGLKIKTKLIFGLIMIFELFKVRNNMKPIWNLSLNPLKEKSEPMDLNHFQSFYKNWRKPFNNLMFRFLRLFLFASLG